MKRYLAYVSALATVLCIGIEDGVGQAAVPGTCYSTITQFPRRIATVDLTTGAAVTTTITPNLTPPLPGLAVNSKGNLYGTTNGLYSKLYRIDPAGNAVVVDTVEDVSDNPFHIIGAIAFDENDVLYASGFGDAPFDPFLFTIDTLTAVASNIQSTSIPYAGLAFDPTNGTLYGSAGGIDSPDLIATINKDTGLETPIGFTGLGGATPDIAFDAAGNLFGVKGGGAGGATTLITINKTTAFGVEVDTVREAGVNLSHLSGFTCYNPSDDGGGEPVTVYVDVKPQACPNKLNVNAKSKVNVAILGTADFDVLDIDVSSLSLAGLTSIDYEYVDVSRPPLDDGPCACTSDTADGYVDLQLKFDNQEILATLATLGDGDEFTLTLEGLLNNASEFTGEDCIVIQNPNDKSSKGPVPESLPASYALDQNYPNPFNPTTTISFSLPVESYVDLGVFNVMGQRVATLVSSTLPAGHHAVQWNATDDAGRKAASGLYMYRIAVGEFVRTQKMLLLE